MLLFVRHALSEGNVHHHNQRLEKSMLGDHFNASLYPHPDPDITETVGREQAREAGRFFKNWMDITGHRPTKVVISPFLRTIHTASLFLEEAELEDEVIFDPLVREYADNCESTTGTARTPLLQMIEDSEHLLKDLAIDTSLITEEIWYDTTPDTDETLLARLEEIWQKYIEDPGEDEIILVFSHGGIGRPLSGLGSTANCEIIQFENGKEPRSLFAPTLGIGDEPQPISFSLPRPPKPL